MSTKNIYKVLLATSIFVLQPVFANADTMKSTDENTLERQLDEQKSETNILAHKMMGEINMASLALDVWRPDAAKNHITKAKKLVNQLDDTAEQSIINTTHKYGSVSYTTKKVEKNYYVPIVDDIMLVSDYGEIFKDKKYNAIEDDAKIVNLSLSVDIREVKKSLQQASDAIDNEKYDEASAAFNRIFTSSILDEEIVTDPLWAVHDNLALAKIMLENENYGSARAALKHAQKHLKQAEINDKVTADADSTKALDKELTELEKVLREKDPTTLQKAKHKLNSWMSEVNSWF